MEREHDTTREPTSEQGSRDGTPGSERTSLLAAERHSFDALSMIFGLIFVAAAGLAFAGELGPIRIVDGEWIGPLLLIGIGLLLVTTLRRDR